MPRDQGGRACDAVAKAKDRRPDGSGSGEASRQKRHLHIPGHTHGASGKPRAVPSQRAVNVARLVLMRDPDWPAIIVQVICDGADVARSTFCGHNPAGTARRRVPAAGRRLGRAGSRPRHRRDACPARGSHGGLGRLHPPAQEFRHETCDRRTDPLEAGLGIGNRGPAALRPGDGLHRRRGVSTVRSLDGGGLQGVGRRHRRVHFTARRGPSGSRSPTSTPAGGR